ncbi:helix-turn-helix domain-containing protein [Actinospica durhamensis]
MHRIALVVVAPITTVELSIPELAFGQVLVAGRPGYETEICAADPGAVVGSGGFELTVRHGLEAVERADTVMVVGEGGRECADPRLLGALREAGRAGKRIVSVCGSVFVLAQAGLVDGRTVTIYWQHAPELRRRFPAVDVRTDVLFHQDGPVLTSAGLTAAVELCLHMIRTDYGSAVANQVARVMVAGPVRPAGQAQVISSPLPPEGKNPFARTRDWALGRLHEPLSLTDLARESHSSVRTLTRRFQAETGMSPLQWLLHQRLERARELLETTDLSLEQVAHHSGLGTADSLRQHLVRRSGITPSAYRAAFARGVQEQLAAGHGAVRSNVSAH